MPKYNGKQAKPAGIFYFKIDDPMVPSDSMVLEVIEKEILKKLKMAGLVLKDVNIIRQLDREIHGYSDIISAVQLKNDGEISAKSNVLDEKEFTALIKHVDQKVKIFSEAILSGNTKIEPAKSGGNTACQFCKYKSVCQFDILFNNNRYRFIKSLDKTEVLNRIAAAGEGNLDG